MNGITHKQAKRHMRAELDGLLDAHQRLDLQTHLRECDACRAESESLASLTVRLQSEFHNRWDKQTGPSANVMANVHSQTRRIMLVNRINTGLRAVGGIAALLVLMLAINSIISQLKDVSVSTTGAQSTENGNTVFSSKTDNRLIAFTSIQDGNYDIYTMQADGSVLTNITNNPAYDSSPYWSPDGKQIAFESSRDGSWGQIYLMNADGSNVVQLTYDQADHQFVRNYGASSSPWSPDGSRLIVSQKLQGEEKWKLYTIDANGENKTLLVSDPNIYNAISWSPDGKSIAFIADNPQSLDGDRLYIANADGSNLREVTEFLLPDEQLFNFDYYWADDGQSIFFVAFSRKAEPYWTAYEARLDDNSLIERATTNTALYYWQNSISVLGEFSIESPIRWLRSDETNNTLHPYEHCTQTDSVLFGSHMKRSSNGNWAINAYCPNGDSWFYYANSDGTMIKQLLNSPLSAKDSDLIDILWSPDDKFIAFNMASANQSDLYILDVSEALKDPSIQPVKMANSYGASWQPIVHNDIVEEKPTSEPTQIDNRLLAFTKEVDGNTEIHTIRADGSGLINLTNNPAHDTSPVWSPDGTRIAFQSDRDGGNPSQIFLMDADGSNTTQLTTDAGDHMLPLMLNGKTSLWSPDGSKLLNMQIGFSDTEWTLQSIDINNGGITSFGSGRFDINNISWSPDGKHIAFVRNDPKNLDDNKFIPQMLIASANGTDLINVNSLLPTGESWQYAYHWSRDGQSISFIASNLPFDSGYGFGSESGNPYYWKIYEVSLDGMLTLRATTHSPIGGWWDGNYFVTPIMGSGGWTWVHPDGSVNTINPTKECEQERLYDAGTNSYTSAIANFSQSPNGNGVIIASCPDGNVHLSWMNSTGTEVAPIAKLSTTPPGGYLDWVLWSQDDRFIAFQLYTSGTTDGYIYMVNIAESLKDPSIPPVKIPLGKGGFIFPLAWQPSP